MDPAAATQWADDVCQVLSIAQAQRDIVIERAVDIMDAPAIGMLALQYVIDETVKVNLAQGNITRDQIEKFRKVIESFGFERVLTQVGGEENG